MMNRNSNLFAILAVLAIGLIYISADDSNSNQDTFVPVKLFPDLISHVETVKTITISGSNNLLLEARLTENGWQSTGLDESLLFPLNEANINRLISDLSTTKIKALKTSDPNKYSQLGVSDIDKQDSTSSLININNGDKEWALLLGKVSQSVTGQYARVPKESTSLLLDKSLSMPSSKMDWLINPAVSLSPNDINVIKAEGEKTIAFTRNDEGEWDKPVEFLNNIVGIDYQDVISRESPSAKWLADPLNTVELETGSTTWTISLYQHNDTNEHWITYDASDDQWQEKWVYMLDQQAVDAFLSLFEEPSDD